MNARTWRVVWGPTRAPLFRLERRTWDTLGDCRRDLWGVSIIRGGWMSQGLERLGDGSWHFNVGPLCLWHETDADR